MSHVTTAADRIAAHRAHTSVAAHALAHLTDAGIGHEKIDGGRYLVANAFMFWPANGYWKQVNGVAFGYGVAKLKAAILPPAEKPALTVVRSADRLPPVTH